MTDKTKKKSVNASAGTSPPLEAPLIEEWDTIKARVGAFKNRVRDRQTTATKILTKLRENVVVTETKKAELREALSRITQLEATIVANTGSSEISTQLTLELGLVTQQLAVRSDELEALKAEKTELGAKLAADVAAAKDALNSKVMEHTEAIRLLEDKNERIGADYLRSYRSITKDRGDMVTDIGLLESGLNSLETWLGEVDAILSQ